LEIEAPRSTWDLAERVVRFEGGVEAVRGPVRFSSDVLTVWFSGPDRVERAVAEGHVRVTRGARSAQGDRAELKPDTGEVVLTGNPKLSEGASELEGIRIVLWLDDERVTCEQCRLVVSGGALVPE
jgi:lipopolysaccharide export system protein LptA